MHIKTITLNNFRSFRQCTTELAPFSPKTNVIVGRNGTGKSNVLDAIQFVMLLSNKFVTLRTEERQSLLHDDAASNVISAYVEIVLDNSSGRLSLDQDEVLLRRTIGSKKDEFFINRKRVQKAEVLNLLESAGFSKSNPYFIIQQGKVHALCTMSDHERLVLLKEVAGTTVYDEKREASLLKMEENESSINKIDESLSYLEQRLVDLEGEKEELTSYQKFDRSRRALEYTLYSTELKKAREYLDELEHMRGENVEQLSELFESARSVHDRIRSVEVRMKQGGAELRRSRQDVEHFTRIQHTQTTTQTKQTLHITELQTQCEQDKLDHQQATAELTKLRQVIVKSEAELAPLVEKCTELNTNLTSLHFKKKESDAAVESIYAMLNRAGMSAAEREEYLRNQISESKHTLKAKQKLLNESTHQIKSSSENVQEMDSTLASSQSQLSNHKQLASSLSSKLVNLKAQRDELQGERVAVQRELGVLEESRADLRDSVMNSQIAYDKSMPYSTRAGLKHLTNTLVAELNLEDNYYGPVIENFELASENFRTAVEVAAGNSLLHVIVDTDETAAKLMRRLETQRLGRVTFLPLNILARNMREQRIEYPESSDVCSLMERCLKFDEAVRPAMQQVFGRKLLAKDWDVGSQWADSSNLDCVTLDGELFQRNGAVSGGWHDSNSLKLQNYLQLRAEKGKLDEVEQKCSALERKLSSFDSRVTKSILEVQKCEAKSNNLRHVMETTDREIASLKTRVVHKKAQQKSLEESIAPLKSEIDHLGSNIDAYEQELDDPPTSETLSEEQHEVIRKHTGISKELSSQCESIEAQFADATLEKDKVEALLRDNYYKKRGELEEIIEDAHVVRGAGDSRRSSGIRRGEEAAHRKRDLAVARTELEQTEQALAKTQTKRDGAKLAESNLMSNLAALKTDLDALKQEDMKSKRDLEDVHQAAEKLMSKRSMYQTKREMYMRKIQELGSLPSGEELNQYSDESVQSLMRRLDKINKELRKYSHVNKKALDQYVNFSEQREELLERKKELDEGRESIQECIESLDRQKDEAISRTFRGVSAHFRDVFSELVPDSGAQGELIMRTNLDEEEEDGVNTDGDSDAESSEAPTKTSKSVAVSMYKGIGIKVRFSALGENYIMSQLSGGQKALVAMALIFAIQRCDPAPFYIFDELDQALDSTHRTAVANLIQRQANSEDNPTQFICTTFRPELVKVANKMYGISHQNKVSNIHQMGRKEGLQFVADLVSEETQGSSIPTAASTSTTRKLEESGSEDEGKSDDDEDAKTSPENSPSPPRASKKVSGKKRSRRSSK